MSDAELPVAIVALVVALAALIVTVSQLLGQIFATAEGTRRCSRSVIGHWNTLTTWRWHWSEWRFETIFASPELYLGVPQKASTPSITSAFRPDTGLDLRKTDNDEKPRPPPDEILGIDDRALIPFREPRQLNGWIPLLRSLHDLAARHQIKSLRRCDNRESTSWPGIRLRYTSWDAMPAGLTGTFATTTLGDIAVIARRMGMAWTTFDPQNEILAAEGGGHVLAPVGNRSLGLALRYISADCKKPFIAPLDGGKGNSNNRSREIWSREADMLMFGVFPGDPALKLPNFRANTDEDILDLFNDTFKLGDQGTDWKHVLIKKAWCKRYEINELKALVCPMLRQRGSDSNVLNYPRYWASIFRFPTAFHCFHELLIQRLATQPSKYLSRIPQHCATLKVLLSQPNGPERHEALHDGHDFTTKYFRSLVNTHPNFFRDLLRAHMSLAPICSLDARNKVRRDRKEARLDHLNDSGHQWRSEQVAMQWDGLPKYAAFMRSVDPVAYGNAAEIEEAWITLYFRGICWHLGHTQGCPSDQEEFLPAKWYNSQLPVYLL